MPAQRVCHDRADRRHQRVGKRRSGAFLGSDSDQPLDLRGAGEGDGIDSAFAQLPLITWRPALGAISYQVQLSRKLYPWNAARTTRAVVPSAVLPLTATDELAAFFAPILDTRAAVAAGA